MTRLHHIRSTAAFLFILSACHGDYEKAAQTSSTGTGHQLPGDATGTTNGVGDSASMSTETASAGTSSSETTATGSGQSTGGGDMTSSSGTWTTSTDNGDSSSDAGTSTGNDATTKDDSGDTTTGMSTTSAGTDSDEDSSSSDAGTSTGDDTTTTSATDDASTGTEDTEDGGQDVESTGESEDSESTDGGADESETGVSDSESDGDTDEGCPTGLVDCSGDCVDPWTNADHCGADDECMGGQACPSDWSCVVGSCQPACEAPRIICDEDCIDPQTDATHCGASGDCVGPQAGERCQSGEVCIAGHCELECADSERIVCDGQCIDPSHDLNYCGASGDCEGPNAGQRCQPGEACRDGRCDPVCEVGEILCDRECVDPMTDDRFCGAGPSCAGNEAGTICGQHQYCNNGACQREDMARVEPGPCWHGCNEAIDDECREDIEAKIYETSTDGFFIDIDVVTVSEYYDCVADGGCSDPVYWHANCNTDKEPQYAQHPINCVSRAQAMAYCAWDGGKRLLTEIEWERACRGTGKNIYPWGNDDISCAYAHYNEQGLGDTSGCGTEDMSPVGQYTPAGDSPEGVHDMIGNINEWTSSDAMVEDSLRAVAKGGGTRSRRAYCRCSTRFLIDETSTLPDYGIRCGADL